MTGAKSWRFLSVRKGYTLIELLIVTAIFSIAMGILAQIFVSFNQLHRKVANAAVLGQDMRFVMELLVREGRNDQIDYSAAINDVDSILKLKKANGMSVWIAQGTPGALAPLPSCEDTTIAACLALSVDDGATWTQITSHRVEVQAFNVFVRPTVSPFVQSGGSYANNTQPFVTVNLGLLYKAERVKERVMLRAQTTVSSRVYQR